MSEQARSTIDQAEVDRFSAMAAEWWDPKGKFRPLHKFNPVRLTYIRDRVSGNFGREAKALQPLKGLRILDIGCGGGLLSEPMARMGADVVGADASEKNIMIAKTHAAGSGVAVDYRAVTAESLAEAGETFDVVLNMEVVEHVADVEFFMSTCASMVRPGGMMFVATINRTMKAAALAIFAAENVLRWLPRGTHQYEKLVRPEELEKPITASGMEVTDRTGVFFNPLSNQWNLSKRHGRQLHDRRQTAGVETEAPGLSRHRVYRINYPRGPSDAALPRHPFVPQQRIDELVAPDAIELVVLDEMRLAPHAQPFDDPNRAGIRGIEPGEGPVEIQARKRKFQNGPHRFGGIALAGKGRIENITDLHLPRDRTFKLQHHFANDGTILTALDGEHGCIAILVKPRHAGLAEFFGSFGVIERRGIKITVDLRQAVIGLESRKIAGHEPPDFKAFSRKAKVGKIHQSRNSILHTARRWVSSR